MSTQVFPSTVQCPGIDISISRKVEWDSIVQEAVSGKETRLARRIYPRREFELKFNFLRSSTTAGFAPAVNELATFEGFFNNRFGMFDSFLWQDPDDNTVVGQGLGNGYGGSAFQLLRAFGGFVEPVYAPNVINNVYVGSTAPVSSTTYTVSVWGSSAPGIVTFSTYAPSTSQAVSVDFTYYIPVRFNDDNMTFDRFVNLIYENKKVGFKSII